MMFPGKQAFDLHTLDIDAVVETNRIVSFLREQVFHTLRKRGVVVGLDGGVESAVVLALGVRAFGAPAVTALLMPDRDSDPSREHLARLLASLLGVETVHEDITSALQGLGCYHRRDEAIRAVVPSYQAEIGHRSKIVMPADLLEADKLNLFELAVCTPEGGQILTPLPAHHFLEIIAAMNIRQRVRMTVLYYHAECRNFAVAGASNRNDHTQGLFVKYGDGGEDIRPIVHLYQTQVRQLAKYLDIPEEISDAKHPPATCSQPDFPFSLPSEKFDLIAYAQDHGIAAEDVAAAVGLSAEHVRRAFRDMMHKHRVTEYLRMHPLSLAAV